MAVKVTFVPGQMGPEGLAAMLTLTGFVFTTIVIVFELAGLPVKQGSIAVSTQVITSPFDRAELVYVAPVPTFSPFFFH